jgi:hypothetical protein
MFLPRFKMVLAPPGAAPDLVASELVALDIVGYTLSSYSQIQQASYSPGTFSFKASVVPGKIYQIQYSTNLVGDAWLDLGAPALATGTTFSVVDTGASGEARYYRLVTVSPPHPLVRVAKIQQQTAAQTGNFMVGPSVTHDFLPSQ